MALEALRSVEPGACVRRCGVHDCVVMSVQVCTLRVNAVRSAFRMGQVYVCTYIQSFTQQNVKYCEYCFTLIATYVYTFKYPWTTHMDHTSNEVLD